MRYIFLLLILSILLNANDEEKFVKLFSYLESNNIIVGKDISTEKLYNIIEKNEIYLDNGELNKKVLNNTLTNMLNTKQKQFDKITEEIKKNPNSKINKEVTYYIEDSNKRVNDTQNNLTKDDTDGIFSSVINYVLGFMKN